MTKVKTRKSLTKRIRVTKNGKILRGHSFTSHLKVKKSSKHKRRLGKNILVEGHVAKKFTKALGIRKSKKNRYQKPTLTK